MGTWLSSPLVQGPYCSFADSVFQPMDDMSLPALPNMTFCSNITDNIAFFDTEGLDYQTELDDNYDIVTVLPHTLIAENVFLIVRDRLNPAEVKDLIDRLAEAAKKTDGTFAHRNGKLFGNFIIVVNKSQSIAKSDEAALETLIEENPSLVKQINQYFLSGPVVVILPKLEWDYADKPDFDEEGFYLNYDHVMTSHPPLRDRMFYGLNKIAYFVNAGVSENESYFMDCANFEDLIESIYEGTLSEVYLVELNIFFQQQLGMLFISVISITTGF